MEEEILAIAIVQPHHGKEAEVVSVLRELYALLRRKGYSRDLLYRDADDGRLFNLRYWRSEDARRHAHEDSDVHQYWRRLSEICEVEKVYERLHDVTSP